MPRLSRWAIRAALLYLGVGFTLGAMLLTNKGLGVWPGIWRWLPAHIEFMLIGWTLQLVIGMGFWILPRFDQGQSRGNEPLAWAALGLLNTGLLATALEPLIPGFGWLLLAGRVLEAMAGLAFAGHAWPRVKPPGA
jgi:hypothetical protein